jgi:hypothetical protein
MPQQAGGSGSSAGGSSGSFVSYCIQKLASGRANHAAFWLQDERGESLLAVVVKKISLALSALAWPAPAACSMLAFDCLQSQNSSALPLPRDLPPSLHTCCCRAQTPACQGISPTQPPRRSWSCAWPPHCAAPTARRCRPGWLGLASPNRWRRPQSGGWGPGCG